MASLRNIMNVDDDHGDSHSLKRAIDSGSRSSQYPESSVPSVAYGRPMDYSTNTTSSMVNQRLSPASRSLHSLPEGQHLSGISFGHAASRDTTDRRQSNTSSDSMESHYGPGHSYTHGHPGSISNAPMRPFVPPQEVPVKLTPITGRVSRAKKGVPVHTCDVCRPPKTFTRAEHLRRHQLSHQPPGLPCPVPECDKVFHRRDLLERHQQRHDMMYSDHDDRIAKSSDGQGSSRSYNSGGSRRPSHTSSPPGGSLIQMRPSYSTASTDSMATTPGPTIPMGSAHWRTQASRATPIPMHASDDMPMSPIKNEYLVESSPPMESTTSNLPDGYSQPRSMPGVASADSVSALCDSDVNSSALSWPVNEGLATPTTSQGSYSSPTVITQHIKRSAINDMATAGWAVPCGQTTSRGIPSSMTTTGGYPIPYGYTTALPQTYASLYEDGHTVNMPGYGQNALCGTHLPPSSIRNASPTLILGQTSEIMMTAPTSLAADRVVSTIPYMRGPCSSLGLRAQDLMPVSLSREARTALPSYIDIYWDKVHPLYPIIHKSTTEEVPDVEAEYVDVLRCAMAAVATQSLGHREHRVNGSQLHTYAWYKCKTFTESGRWPLPIMQAVLLCEYYARFRGRHKEDYQTSTQFAKLHQMLSCYRSSSMPDLPGCNNSERWRTWVAIESSRRLLAACFLLSVHGMCYHEQPYSTVSDVYDIPAAKFQIPLSANTMTLWEAGNADAWAMTEDSPISFTTVEDVMRDPTLCGETAPPFDVSLVIAALALQLPKRCSRQELELVDDISRFNGNDLVLANHFTRRPGANTYLALHYTPLHILLAVSGDSWVFNKKIPDAGLFAEFKQKLGQWRNSGTSAIACSFAARAIRDFLNLGQGKDSIPTNPARDCDIVAGKEISDYWGLYVCTLICWAYGHVGKRSTPDKRVPVRDRAVGWIQTVAELEPDQLRALPGREDSQCIVGFVRDILERDCLGGRNILFADAMGVLRKLEEVDNWSWF